MTNPSEPKSEVTLGERTTAGVASPLSEASAQSLEVLMSRDPFEMLVEDEQWTETPEGWKHRDGRLTKSSPRNFDALVAAYRAERERWKLAEANGATRAPKAPSAAKAKTSLSDLGLDDL